METFADIVIFATIIAGIAIPVGFLLLLLGLAADVKRLRKFSLRLLLVAGLVLLASFTFCSLGIVRVSL